MRALWTCFDQHEARIEPDRGAAAWQLAEPDDRRPCDELVLENPEQRSLPGNLFPALGQIAGAEFVGWIALARGPAPTNASRLATPNATLVR